MLSYYSTKIPSSQGLFAFFCAFDSFFLLGSYLRQAVCPKSRLADKTEAPSGGFRFVTEGQGQIICTPFCVIYILIRRLYHTRKPLFASRHMVGAHIETLCINLS